MILGAGLGYAGSEVGKDLSHNFDFDVLGWLTGKNDRTPTAEKAVPQADWKWDDGRMYSELSARERITYVDSAAESARREEAQIQRDNTVNQAKTAEFETESAKKQVEVFNRHKKDASAEEIISKTAQFEKEDRQKRTGGTSLANDYSKNFQAVNDNNKFAVDTQKSGRETFWKGITDFFSGIGETVKNDSEVRLAAQKPKDSTPTAVEVGKSGFNPITGQSTGMPTNIWTDFKMPELNIGAKIQNEVDFVTNTVGKKIENLKTSFSEAWTNFNISDYLPEFNLSEWFNEKFSDVETPDFSQMWADFDISDFLPEVNVSEWFSEKFSDIEIPDIVSLLPDLNLSEWCSTIEPPDISALLPDFSTITAPANDAFNSISTSATEAWTTVQTAWNELPSFFSGIFEGLGGIATAAGSAIASGLNSAIGTIQSAWESLSSWLSDKISSLSNMASNAVSSITSAIGGGNVSPKAEGGFITSPQHILAGEAGTEVIIPLASSRRTRAMDLLKKTAAIIGGDSVNIIGDKFKGKENISAPQFEELGTIKSYDGLKDNLITADDDLLVRPSKQKQQRKEIEKMLSVKTSFENISSSKNTLETVANISSNNISAPQFDELGNIKEFSGLSDNVITADDDLSVRRSKKEAQLKEFWANNSELGEGLSTEDGAITSGNGNVDNSVGGVEVGGIQATFQLSDAENPQDVIQTIKENLGDLADQIGGKIAEKISEIRMNMPLTA